MRFRHDHGLWDAATFDPVSAIVATVGSFFADAGAATAGLIGADAGVGVAIGTGLEGATIGAGLGAGAAAIEHGNPLLGALSGGVTGGTAGLLASGLSGTGGTSVGPNEASSGATPATAAAQTLGVPAGAPAGASAASISAPVAGAAPPDLTSADLNGFIGSVDTGPLTSAPAASNAVGTAPSAGAMSGADTPQPVSFDASGNQVMSPRASASATPVQLSGGAMSGADTLAAHPYGGAQNSGGLFGKIGDFLGSSQGKALGTAAQIGLIGKDLIGGSSIPGMGNVKGIAQQLGAQGQVLSSYLQNGTLPPAVQASVDAATRDGITSIKSRYAAMGIAPGSSAEVQDIAHLKQNAVVQGATLADQLLQQGISESQLSGELYAQLVGYNTQLNNQTGQAISNLASSLAGGGRPVIQIGGGGG